MRVILDARSITAQPTGIGIYARELVKALATLRGLELHVLGTSTTHFPSMAAPTYRFASGLGFHYAAQHFAGRMRDALYHSPSSAFVPALLGRRSIVTVHDLVPVRFPQTTTWKTRLGYQLLRRTLPRVGGIIVPSEATQRDLTSLWSIPVPIDVVHEAPRQLPAPELGTLHVPEHFFLTVGTLEPRKNLRILIEAYERALNARADLPPLLITGHSGWGNQSFLNAAAQQHPNRIRVLGYVSDAQLAALYQRATAFLYSSLYEGFGLPPIEAASYETLVICSDIPACREVLAGGAVFLEPTSVAAWSDALLRAASDGDWRTTHARAGKACAERLTWIQAAEQTRGVYNRVAGSGAI